MTHYDTLIRDFLLEHKTVSLDGIGTLTASADVTPGSFTYEFTFDKRVVNSPELIDYIAQHTGKNRVLIQSDLQSHFELTRQFINIGKPYELEGVGAISISRDGSFVFTPHTATDRKEELKTAKKKQMPASTGPKPPGRSNRGVLMVVALFIIIAVAALIGWGTYKLFIGNGVGNSRDTINKINTVKAPDTSGSVVLPLKNDSSRLPGNDSANFVFFFERTFSRGRATSRADELRSEGYRAGFDSIWVDTANLYRLYIRMRLRPSDTAYMRDSMERHLQHSVTILP